MDFSSLVQLLAPALPALLAMKDAAVDEGKKAIAKQIVTKGGEDLQKLWQTLQPQIVTRETANIAATELARAPESVSWQTILQAEIERILRADGTLAAEVTTLCKALQPKIEQQVTGDSNQILGSMSGGTAIANVSATFTSTWQQRRRQGRKRCGSREPDERASLTRQLSRARRALQILQEQRAGFGLRVPVDLELEIEEKQRAIVKLEAKLAPPAPNSSPQKQKSGVAGSSLPDRSVANPFGDLGRITNPQRFWGREELMRRVFEALAQGTSLSLVGESQIGKSSILSMICHWGPERLRWPVKAFQYVDLQTIRDEADMYEELYECLGFSSPPSNLRRALKANATCSALMK